MNDPRRTPADERKGASSLEGRHHAARKADGTDLVVLSPTAPILASPEGPRSRELLLGQRFCVLETRADAHFGFARRDGYAGWVPARYLGTTPAPTHRVSAIRSHARKLPRLKDTGPVQQISLGSLVHVTAGPGTWGKIRIGTEPWYLPLRHLAPIGSHESDPVAVAQLFLGTPYLWGGNSAFGIDCSGLVQAALLACGLECPGDSDQQQAALGRRLPDGTPAERGDLLFWKGHVALCLDRDRIIHANAHAMAVAVENTETARARIAAAGEGPIVAHKRLATARTSRTSRTS